MTFDQISPSCDALTTQLLQMLEWTLKKSLQQNPDESPRCVVIFHVNWPENKGGGDGGGDT